MPQLTGPSLLETEIQNMLNPPSQIDQDPSAVLKSTAGIPWLLSLPYIGTVKGLHDGPGVPGVRQAGRLA
jgi:hypothetical protein